MKLSEFSTRLSSHTSIIVVPFAGMDKGDKHAFYTNLRRRSDSHNCQVEMPCLFCFYLLVQTTESNLSLSKKKIPQRLTRHYEVFTKWTKLTDLIVWGSTIGYGWHFSHILSLKCKKADVTAVMCNVVIHFW